ncbi:MAG TPA: hypothetical protein VHB77_13085, partial [Planctomycetaceae bacterium]|nr:hypothetical protein [Planctomycetaceae bacterium]
RQLNTLKTANPRIGRCLSPEAAVNATATFDYNATFREFQSAFVDFVRTDEVAAEDKDECDREIENLLADIVGKIFPGERIDAALQYDGAPGAGVMLVGWSIPEGDQLQKSIGELLARTADAEGDDEEPDTGFVEEYRGRSIYEVDDAGEADDAIFGKGARTYFAVSSDAVWIAMGGEQALPTLKKALDASADQPQASVDRAPLDVTIHGAKVQVYGEGTDDEDAREIAEKAFKDSDDRIRIELTGIENGMRLRSSVGEAFVRLAALAAVKGLEDVGLLKK